MFLILYYYRLTTPTTTDLDGYGRRYYPFVYWMDLLLELPVYQYHGDGNIIIFDYLADQHLHGEKREGGRDRKFTTYCIVSWMEKHGFVA